MLGAYMPSATLTDMGKKKEAPKVADADRKKVGISVRFDAALLERIDAWCRSQEFKIDRTEFLEVAARKLIEEKEAER